VLFFVANVVAANVIAFNNVVAAAYVVVVVVVVVAHDLVAIVVATHVVVARVVANVVTVAVAVIYSLPTNAEVTNVRAVLSFPQNPPSSANRLSRHCGPSTSRNLTALYGLLQ
jgi:hypothetical protein